MNIMAAKELKYGAKHPCWAPIVTQPENALPTYGTGLVMSELSKVAETLNFAEGEIYFDDELSEQVSEFRSGGLTVDHKGMEDATLEQIYGSQINDGVLEDGGADNPPLGGFAFYTKIREAGVTSFRGIHYPVVQARIAGETYDTKGNAITLAGGQTVFIVYQSKTGKWRRRKRFATEADAKLWVEAQVGVTEAHLIEITISGAGEVIPSGNIMVADGEDLEINVGTATKVYDDGVDVTASVVGGKYTLTNVLAAHKIAVIFTS
jgi:hypothetical protein